MSILSNDANICSVIRRLKASGVCVCCTVFLTDTALLPQIPTQFQFCKSQNVNSKNVQNDECMYNFYEVMFRIRHSQ